MLFGIISRLLGVSPPAAVTVTEAVDECLLSVSRGFSAVTPNWGRERRAHGFSHIFSIGGVAGLLCVSELAGDVVIASRID
jgi:hypothetical protein